MRYDEITRAMGQTFIILLVFFLLLGVSWVIGIFIADKVIESQCEGYKEDGHKNVFIVDGDCKIYHNGKYYYASEEILLNIDLYGKP